MISPAFARFVRHLVPEPPSSPVGTRCRCLLGSPSDSSLDAVGHIGLLSSEIFPDQHTSPQNPEALFVAPMISPPAVL